MADSSPVIHSRQSFFLDLPPSCIEFCPAFPHFFLVGTYNLVKDEETLSPTSTDNRDGDNSNTAKRPQNRNGSVVVFKLEGGKLSQMQTLLQPSALLDLHFCPHAERHDIAAVASSTGTLAILKMNPINSPECPLKVVQTSQVFPTDVLVLSCAWHPSWPHLIGVTTSTGEVHILNLNGSYQATGSLEHPVIQHSLEAWTLNMMSMPSATGDGKETLLVYSGADDSKLCHTKCTVRRESGDGIEHTLGPIAGTATVKGHDAGVTAILPLPIFLVDGTCIVVTGSYDDTIRVFAMDHSEEAYYCRRSGRLLGELSLGGGVWRLRHIDTKKDNLWRIRILASCMHAGARILELEGSDTEEWSFRVLCRFQEHKSMNYGSDFSPPGVLGDRLVCISTSFYDKLLCLWEWVV